VVRLRQPLGQESKTGYNAWGFKASAIDANGNDATWRTDYFGRVLGHKDIGKVVYRSTPMSTMPPGS
jgi:YD repeat-containing protein